MPAARADLKKPYLKDNSQRVQRAELENWSPALKVASAEHGCVSLFGAMKAVVISRPGPPDVLKIEERPKPSRNQPFQGNAAGASSLSLSALLIASINSRIVPKSRLCGVRTIR